MSCLSCKLLILILLMFSGAFAHNLTQSQIENAAKDPVWLSLLKYPKGEHKSEIKDQSFFLSPYGSESPKDELIATIDAAATDRMVGNPKQEIVCAYPARVQFIEKKLGVKLPIRDCPKWNRFYSRFNKKRKISIIFSSSYTNNPASMFGHLFLKIGDGKISSLNDIGINYAARVPETENSVAFLYFGVFGGYEGHWSIQPYYEKINEYVKAENRDLWEYQLNLSEDEVDFLIRHLWELETASTSQYYFFDENCAYEIVRLVESVKPSWDISSHSLYVIPGEIIKNLYKEQSIVSTRYYHPSLKKKLSYRYNLLPISSKQKIKRFIYSEGSDDSDQLDILELNSLNTYYDYMRHLKKGQLTSIEAKKWEEVQIKRANLGVKSQQELIVSEENPEQGHDSNAVGLFVGKDNINEDSNKSYLGFSFRFAYHDLLNNDKGFLPNSQIIFPSFEIRKYTEDKDAELFYLNLIDIISLNPISDFDQDLSWKLNMNFTRDSFESCENCLPFNWRGALGYSFYLGSQSLVSYTFVGGRLQFHDHLSRGYLPYLTGELGLLYSSNKGKYLLNYYIDQSLQNNVQNSKLTASKAFFISRNQEFLLSIEQNKKTEINSQNNLQIKGAYYLFFN